MIMKILTYVLIAVLIAGAGIGVFYYVKIHRPMVADYERMKAGLPALDKASADLKKYKDREKSETAWIGPVIDAVSTGLNEEIKAGSAEVIPAAGKVVVNIAEQAVYMPGSYTFSRESIKVLDKIAALLKDDRLKGREIMIGNTTQAVPAQGKGRKKTPAKDARTLAADRSAALIKHLEKSGVKQDFLIAAAYPADRPALGFKLKDRKIVIVIENPAVLPTVSSKQEPAPAPSAPISGTASTAPAAQAQPITVPIQPAQPKAAP